MTENNQVRRVKVRKKKDKLGFNWFFWISCVIILIPCIYFASLLIEASKETHIPVLGDRISDTITNSISDSEVTSIKNDVANLANCESAEVNLFVETLRITINGKDGLTKEDYTALAQEVYSIVDHYLPITKYFTRVEEYKQYDLEINVYDNVSNENPILVTMFKNSSMEESNIQVLSDPLNAELAYQLLHPEETPTEDPEDDSEETYATDEE